MGSAATADDISPYGIAAVAGLVGMFSKQATDKLEELFNNLFKTDTSTGDGKRGDKLKSAKPVADVMLTRGEMTVYEAQGPDDSIPLNDIRALLRPGVTRIPILETSGALRYLIHELVLSQGPTTGTPMLSDLIAVPATAKLMRDAIAFVGGHATVGDAKSAMESLERCQDVFVTATGNRSEAVEGWLTNVDLGRALSA